MSEIRDYSFPDHVAGRQMLTAVHTFHALLVPEVHLEALSHDETESWEDPLTRYPHLEVFRDIPLRTKTSAVQRNLYHAARWLKASDNVAVPQEIDLREQMVHLADCFADTDYDRPLWIDRAGGAMSVNQILPELPLLEHAVNTHARWVQSYELLKFIGASLDALGDRAPKL